MIVVIVAGTTAVLLLASVEGFWRYRGAEPNRVDDLRRWSFYREKVDSLEDPDDTVLVGASRMQLGWSFEEFRSRLPETELIQLAIDGTHPWAVIEDLSENTAFAGVLIVSLTAPAILPENREAAARHVNYFSGEWSVYNKVNFLIENFLQGHLVTRQFQYGLGKTIENFAAGKALSSGANYLETTAERERNAFYERLDIAGHRAERVRRVIAGAEGFQAPTSDGWSSSLRDLKAITAPIVERGGRVVFIRFPVSDESWAYSEKMYPRDVYWDSMAKTSPGLWIHFKDIEGADQFVLPDTSHLDQRDKAAFTGLVMDRLQDLGVYETSRKPGTGRL